MFAKREELEEELADQNYTHIETTQMRLKEYSISVSEESLEEIKDEIDEQRKRR